MEEKNYSDQTAYVIDQEIRGVIDECHVKAKEVLSENRDRLRLLAETLLEKEVLDAAEVKRLLGLSPHEPQTSPTN